MLATKNATASQLVQVQWPLYTVYPASACCFYLWYAASPLLSVLLPRRYKSMHAFDQKCWRQNIASAMHSLAAVSIVIVVLANDRGISAANLRPIYNEGLYVAASISLAFFTFALPWSLRMYFVLRARQPFTRLSLCVHHAIVFAALLVYLLTQYCPFQSGLAFVLLEGTNWLYVPHLLLTQLGFRGTACWTAIGILFVLAFVACRIFAASWLVVQMTIDFAHFDPPHDGGWAASAVVLASLFVLQYLSFFWFVVDIVPSTHAGLKDLLGETYHHVCCPVSKRRRVQPEACDVLST